MTAAPLPIVWRPRADPLVPSCVLARGAAASHLVQRVLTRDDEALARLRGVATTGAARLVAFEGAAEDLPWVDGAEYLGRHAAAPSLLVPTAVGPDVHPALFERAVLRARPDLVQPVAVTAGGAFTLSLAAALPLDRGRLMAWLESNP